MIGVAIVAVGALILYSKKSSAQELSGTDMGGGGGGGSMGGGMEPIAPIPIVVINPPPLPTAPPDPNFVPAGIKITPTPTVQGRNTSSPAATTGTATTYAATTTTTTTPIKRTSHLLQRAPTPTARFVSPLPPLSTHKPQPLPIFQKVNTVLVKGKRKIQGIFNNVDGTTFEPRRINCQDSDFY